jgi:hypothetical protein
VGLVPGCALPVVSRDFISFTSHSDPSPAPCATPPLCPIVAVLLPLFLCLPLCASFLSPKLVNAAVHRRVCFIADAFLQLSLLTSDLLLQSRASEASSSSFS